MKIKNINPFTDIEDQPLEQSTNELVIRSLRELQTGPGAAALRIDKEGIWLGALKIADAKNGKCAMSKDGYLYGLRVYLGDDSHYLNLSGNDIYWWNGTINQKLN